VVRLANGGFAAADWGAKTIFIFDSGGNVVRRVGGQGSGPAEFQGPQLVQRLRGDTLLVWDQFLRRLSWVDPHSGQVFSVQLDVRIAYGARPVVGQLHSGRIVVRHESIVPSDRGGSRRSVRLYLADKSGGEVKELGQYEGGSEDGQGYRFFAPSLRTMTDGRLVYVGFNSRWLIEVIDAQGRRVDSLYRPWAPAIVDSKQRARLRDLFSDRGSPPSVTADDRFDSTIPAFGAILLDDEGYKFVAEYAAPYSAPKAMQVFDPANRWICEVALPADFLPTEVGRDYMLGIRRTEEEDPEILLYRHGPSN
jgi:hypothetical protein